MENRIPIKLQNENFTQLELPTLLQKLSEFLQTPYGFDPFQELEVQRDARTIRELLQQVAEMMDLEGSEYVVPLGELPDIRPLLEKLRPEDSFLEAVELTRVKDNLEKFSELAAFFREHRENCPGLYRIAERIHSHPKIVQEIDHTLDERGEIRDDATPELRRIRREIHRLENEVKHLFGKLLKKYSEFSQDEIITLRDGRMVLGIQQHYVNKVPGIVHGTSGSGATVFVEPMESLRLSNQIQNLKIEERQEIIRILQFLSGLIREVRDDIFYSLENLGVLDFIHAKAELARQLQATVPQIGEEPRLKLLNARHPLLILKMGHQNVVPLSLTLGEDFHTLVITGPNAGGKTVALKTVGLLVLMTQLGIPIPAQPDSVVPVLDQVLVDIGDRQSLEQDLSTFSAHIVRLREILRQAHTHTLVLLDEIGTGTDPREGSALAIAVLKELTERKTLTIATTHHGELKAFANDTSGVENASMEFDLESLQPTYRLHVGIPGSSYAFEIARRYGLPEKVLQEAEKILGPDKGKLENILLKLNARLQEIDKERRELSIKLSEAEGLRNLYQQEVERLKREQKELRRKAAEEAEQIVKQANARIEKLVAEIRRTQAEKEKIREAHREIERLEESVQQILQETRPRFVPTDQLKKGDVVWIEDLRQEGELLSDPDNHNKAWVLVGEIRMKMDVSQLKKVARERTETGKVFRHREALPDKLEGGVTPELDLRGMDSYEALQAVDRYLHQAMEESWEEVRIIHGKGSGVLRRVVNDFLARDKRVAEKRFGKWGEGDTGVTIVKLNRGENANG